MTEPRKVSLKSVGFSVPPNKIDGKKEETPKTRRFNLTLTESTDDTFPEFSYLELFNSGDKNGHDDSNAPQEYDPDDPFAIGDRAAHDKLVNLAKKYEDKYNTPKSGKRKRKDRVRDLVNLGDGYDEEDSFVDNSEAYDEYMPCSVSTKYGGFYINTGHLVLIPVEDESNQDVMPCRKKPRKMNALTDSEESSSSDDERKPSKSIKKKHSRDLTGFNVVKKRIKKSFAPSKILKKPAVVIKQQNGLANHEVPKVSLVAQPLVAQPLTIVANNCSPTTKLPPVGQTSTNQFPSDAEKLFACTVRLSRSLSVLAGEKSKMDDVCVPDDEILLPSVDLTINNALLVTNIDAQLCRTDTQVSKVQFSIESQTLSPDLREAIEKVAAAARLSEGGRIKQFTPEVNDILLKIEDLNRAASSNIRFETMTKLGTYFACGKDGLMKRALKRSLTESDAKLKEATTNLKEAIRIVMLPLIEQYNADNRNDGESENKSESDDDENDELTLKQKKIADCRKKTFLWTDVTRQCLCRVVEIRMERYEVSKLRKEPARSYLLSFLNSTVKPLWETGWIQMRDLLRESRKSHARWTETVKSNKSEGTVSLLPAYDDSAKKTQSSVNGHSSKQRPRSHSPVLIDVEDEQSRKKSETHAKETPTTSEFQRLLQNKVLNSSTKSNGNVSLPAKFNGGVSQANKVKRPSTTDQSKGRTAQLFTEPMVIDLTDDVVDTSRRKHSSENSQGYVNPSTQALKPDNVAFWAKCLDAEDKSDSTDRQLKKYTKYYAADGSIIDTSLTAEFVNKNRGAQNTRVLSGDFRSKASSAVGSSLGAGKMDSDAITRSAQKLMAEAGYDSFIPNMYSANPSAVLGNKLNDNKLSSSGTKVGGTEQQIHVPSGVKTSNTNGFESQNSGRNPQKLSLGNRSSTGTSNRVESSRSTNDLVQPVAMWCTADLVSSSVSVVSVSSSVPFVSTPGTAPNRSTLKGTPCPRLIGGCEKAAPQTKSPAPLGIHTLP